MKRYKITFTDGGVAYLMAGGYSQAIEKADKLFNGVEWLTIETV